MASEYSKRGKVNLHEYDKKVSFTSGFIFIIKHIQKGAITIVNHKQRCNV